ncbi:hypothetical protein ACEPAI_1487 [Sanghuangporus weigelae]
MALFGAWDSLIIAEYVAEVAVSFDDVLADPLPSQAHPKAMRFIISRNVLLKEGWYARSAVHEYGAQAWCISRTSPTCVSTVDTNADGAEPSPVTPDGTRPAWIQWNHPDMPWDGAQVYVADVAITEDKTLELQNSRNMKGIYTKASAVSPQWVDSNTLFFFSDDSSEPRAIFSSPVKMDFSEPDWNLGMSSSAVLTSSTAYVIPIRYGRYVLFLLDLIAGALKEIQTEYVLVGNMVRALRSSQAPTPTSLPMLLRLSWMNQARPRSQCELAGSSIQIRTKSTKY